MLSAETTFGECTGVGTAKTFVHFGHFTCFPAKRCGTIKTARQEGQLFCVELLIGCIGACLVWTSSVATGKRGGSGVATRCKLSRDRNLELRTAVHAACLPARVLVFRRELPATLASVFDRHRSTLPGENIDNEPTISFYHHADGITERGSGNAPPGPLGHHRSTAWFHDQRRD